MLLAAFGWLLGRLIACFLKLFAGKLFENDLSSHFGLNGVYKFKKGRLQVYPLRFANYMITEI